MHDRVGGDTGPAHRLSENRCVRLLMPKVRGIEHKIELVSQTNFREHVLEIAAPIRNNPQA